MNPTLLKEINYYMYVRISTSLIYGLPSDCGPAIWSQLVPIKCHFICISMLLSVFAPQEEEKAARKQELIEEYEQNKSSQEEEDEEANEEEEAEFQEKLKEIDEEEYEEPEDPEVLEEEAMARERIHTALIEKAEEQTESVSSLKVSLSCEVYPVSPIKCMHSTNV